MSKKSPTELTRHYQRTATWQGAPHAGDIPISLDQMAEMFEVDDNTPYTWSHRDVLPQHDGVCGRSRWWWHSRIIRWYAERNLRGGRRQPEFKTIGEIEADRQATEAAAA